MGEAIMVGEKIMMISTVLSTPVLTVVRCAVLTGRADTKIIFDIIPHKYRKYIKVRGGA